MVKHTVLMIVLFALIVGATAWGFVREPTGFLPTEDQGYAVLVSILPEGASQPRSRAVAEKISALLEKTDGLAAWVTIGGCLFVILPQRPPRPTTSSSYKDMRNHGQAVTHDRRVA